MVLCALFLSLVFDNVAAKVRSRASPLYPLLEVNIMAPSASQAFCRLAGNHGNFFLNFPEIRSVAENTVNIQDLFLVFALSLLIQGLCLVGIVFSRRTQRHFARIIDRNGSLMHVTDSTTTITGTATMHTRVQTELKLEYQVSLTSYGMVRVCLCLDRSRFCKQPFF